VPVPTAFSTGTAGNVPIEAVWAGVAAAVLAALIAAVSSYLHGQRLIKAEQMRLTQSLEAERARLESRLAAEAANQKSQLDHDRLLRDLAEVRNRIDDVIDMGEAALSAICEARLAFNSGNQTATDDQLWQARQCLGQYGYKERRVRLRIGQEHAVITALTNYRDRLQALYSLTHGSLTQNSAVPLSAWNSGMAEVAAAQVGVIEAGERTVGARIAPGEVAETK
jgi:hypothetical protein